MKRFEVTDLSNMKYQKSEKGLV